MSLSSTARARPDVSGLPLVVYGLGRAGTALARGLDHFGCSPLLLVAPRGARWPALLPTGTRVVDAREGGAAPAIWLLAVPDDSLEETARQIVADGTAAEGSVFLHLSGAKGVTVLGALAKAGYDVGGVHPLQSLAPDHAWTSPQSFVCAIEGVGRAREAAERVGAVLGVDIVHLPAGMRASYHLSAVLAGNLVIGLLHQACARLARGGIEEPQALRMLLPLMRGALDNAERRGLAGGLTGPVARGDGGTIATHLSLATGGEEVAYRALSEAALELAERTGLPAEEVTAIRHLLTGAPLD